METLAASDKLLNAQNRGATHPPWLRSRVTRHPSRRQLGATWQGKAVPGALPVPCVKPALLPC